MGCIAKGTRLRKMPKENSSLDARHLQQGVALAVAVVALPGEIFVELGLALKKASPFKHTFIAELSNGSIGYIPNQEAYPQGNYEIVSARGEAGSGEKLVEVALKLLNEAKAAE